MLIFLHGEDSFLVMRRKQALTKAFLKKYAGAERFVFDFEDQGTPHDVERALEACEGGLFATEKMIVFLHPFELSDVSEKLLVNFLKTHVAMLPEHTLLFFVHVGKIKKTHPLTKQLLAKVDKEEVVDAAAGRTLQNLIAKELAVFNENVRLEGEALRLFLALTAGDTARQMTELEKLSTWKEAGVVTVDDVRMLLALPEEITLWGALDALGREDRATALLLFHQEVAKSEGVYPVLSMCAWQVRRLLLIREAYDRGIRRPADIASATKLPPFTVQKALSTIEHFPLARIKRGLTLLSDIDTALKQGKADPETSLDLFVWKF